MLQNSQLVNRSVIRYSNALYGVEKDKNKQNKVFEEIKKLLNILDSSSNFNLIFKSPLLNKKQQNEVVLDLFSETDKKKIIVSKTLFGLLVVLAKNSKLYIFQDVLKRYLDLHNSDNKELKVTVSSVVKLSEDLEGQLKKIFSKNGKMEVKLVNLIDKELLGGLIIQVGSNLIDTSIRTKISKIKSVMKGAN